MEITVRYWVGTSRLEGKASSYEEAMGIAARNRNLYSATYWDQAGRQVFDDGHGLAYPEEEDGRRIYAV